MRWGKIHGTQKESLFVRGYSYTKSTILKKIVYKCINTIYSPCILQAKSLYKDDQKGIMTPPVLVDLTGDNVEDIVMQMFNSTIVAIDGETYKQLWNYSVPSSESYR